MKRISQILEEFIEKNPSLRRLRFFRFDELLKKAMGDVLASKISFEDYEDGVLVIRCGDPMWRSELELMKRKIIDRINELAGERLVRKMVIRRG